MPSSIELITSNTLTTSAASVTFSSIPGTFTDLVLKMSTRHSGTSFIAFFLQFNDTSTIYSFTEFYTNDGSTVASNRASSQTSIYTRGNPSDNQTVNTFSNQEIYIPNYAGSTNKPVSGFFVGENNATSPAWVAASAGLYRSSSAISSITLTPATATINSGSSFFLYGIKNS